MLLNEDTPHIGTLREKPLHASLKQWYAEPDDGIEIAVDEFVIDLVRDDQLVEIQTKGFASMKAKTNKLLARGHQILIVYPIALDRWIVKVGDDGTVSSRRKSPKRGIPTDVFAELVSFPELLAHPGLELELVMIREDEYRRHTPDKAWRRKGWVTLERRLIEVVDTILIAGPRDLIGLIPAGLPEPFTTSDLAFALGRPRRAAQQMAYCLKALGLIEVVGKTANARQYRVT